MPIFTISEQSGPCEFRMQDVLAGIKAEAEKKGIQVEDYYNSEKSPDTVLVVGYSERFMQTVCGQLLEANVTPVAVCSPPEIGNFSAPFHIGFDFYKATFDMLTYLKDCEKKHIAVIESDDGSMAYKEKKRAVEKVRGVAVTHFDVSEIAEFVQDGIAYFDAVLCLGDSECALLSAQLKKADEKTDAFIACAGGCEMIAKSGITAFDCNYKMLGVQAVKLHQYIKLSKPETQVCQSLIPKIVYRSSTGNISPKIHKYVAIDRPVALKNNEAKEYFLKAENLLRHIDMLDRSILAGLVGGKTLSRIAEELFISNSSVKYRVKKMLEFSCLSNRRELEKLVTFFEIL